MTIKMKFMGGILKLVDEETGADSSLWSPYDVSFYKPGTAETYVVPMHRIIQDVDEQLKRSELSVESIFTKQQDPMQSIVKAIVSAIEQRGLKIG